MLGRVAENLYWLGRNLERAETIARIADVDTHSQVEQHDGDDRPLAWDALLAALGAEEQYEEALADNPTLTEAEFLLFSRHNPNALSSIVTHARALARELREHISREVFEELNQLYLTAGRERSLSAGLRRPFLTSVKRSVAATIGLFDNTVLLTEGREWFRCGLFIERADLTSRILDAKYFVILPSVSDVGGPVDRFQWMEVLRSASALEAFRKRYRTPISGPRVADLLIFDREFPRSLTFSLQALQRHFGNATVATPAAQRVHVQRELTMLELDLAAMDTETIVREGLHEFIDDFQGRLIAIDRAMTEHLFRALPEMVR